MVDLVRYLAVDDVGKKINPMIVDGQLHGGIAQGVGQALWEQAIYSDDGQLLTGSMMDYALPRAAWFPNIELDETVTRRRSTRSASRASARRARSPALPPWPTPSTTRSRRSASTTSTCRIRRRRSGPRSRPRREAGMIPAAFDYVRPGSIEEAAQAAGQPGAKVIAGGQSLLPLMKLRLARPTTLVDIGRIAAPGRYALHGGRRSGDRGDDDLRPGHGRDAARVGP